MSADFSQLIKERRACRLYKPDAVPEAIIREVLAEARWAPSATNTQSTNVYVLQDELLAKFKAELRTLVESEVEPNPDIPGKPLPPFLAERQQALFKTRAEFVAAEDAKLGIDPATSPSNPMVAGATIFGAPVVLMLGFTKDMGMGYGLYDAGLFSMAITLAAQARGLATCITGSNTRYPDVIRRLVPGTDNINYVAAIALGYPDWDAPINRFPRTRLAVDEFTQFVK
jgi:nitroreductase